MKRLNRLTGDRLSAAFCSSDAHISVFLLLFAARLNFLLLLDLCDSAVFVRRPEAALCDSVCEFSLLPPFVHKGNIPGLPQVFSLQVGAGGDCLLAEDHSAPIFNHHTAGQEM